MKGEFVTRFRDAEGFDGVGQFAEPIHRVLGVMGIGRDLGEIWMTPHEVSLILRDGAGIPYSRQRVQGLLDQAKGLVVSRRRSGKLEYQVMQAGLDAVDRATPSVLFVEPSRALSGIRQLESLLESLQGVVRLCDPYVDVRTIDFLTSCTNATEIRLLTKNIRDASKVRRDTQAFNREHGRSLTIRQAAVNDLHDRYAIADAEMLLLGTSLNGFGGKQTFVVRLGEDVRDAVLIAFDRLWNSASAL